VNTENSGLLFHLILIRVGGPKVCDAFSEEIDKKNIAEPNPIADLLSLIG